jgi:hypothetical protein
MAQELVNTSVPRGLRSGDQGYCTVAYTAGMPPNYVTLAEALSTYSPVFGASDPRYLSANPTAFSHYRVTVGGQALSVLSRVACHALDFTGRSNYLAHHLLLDRESEVLSPTGPAAVMRCPATFRRGWDEPPRLIADSRCLPAVAAAASARAQSWVDLGIDPGWAGQLAARFMDDPASVTWILYDPEKTLAGSPDEVLRLAADAGNLLPPESRWRVTFTTYYQRPFLQSPCNWCFCAHGSRGLKEARFRPADLRIDLAGPLPELESGNELVECARSGAAPTWASWRPEVTAAAALLTAPGAVTRVSVGQRQRCVQVVEKEAAPGQPAVAAGADGTAPERTAPGPHEPSVTVARLVLVVILALALLAAAFLYHFTRKTYAGAPRASTAENPVGLDRPTPASAVTLTPASPPPPGPIVEQAEPALAPVVPAAAETPPAEPPKPSPEPPPGPVVLVASRVKTEEHSLKDIQEALRRAGIADLPTAMTALRLRLFVAASAAAPVTAAVTADEPVRMRGRDASGIDREIFSYAFTGERAKGSLDVFDRGWQLSSEYAGPGSAPLALAIIAAPNGPWRAVDILRCLEFPLRFTAPVFVPPAEAGEAGFGGRLELDLTPALAAFPAEVAEPALHALTDAGKEGVEALRLEWSAEIAFSFPTAAWGQERAAEKASFVGSLEPGREAWRRAFSLQPQFDRKIGHFLKEYEQTAARGISEQTAKELQSAALLALAETYAKTTKALLEPLLQEERKRLCAFPPPDGLAAALDRLHGHWAKLSAAALESLLDTSKERDSELIAEEDRVLYGRYNEKRVGLDEERFINYRRTALKQLWLCKLRDANGVAPSVATERLLALGRQRLRGHSQSLDTEIEALRQEWQQLSPAELEKALLADDRGVPLSLKTKPLGDKQCFLDYKRDTLQQVWLQKRLAEVETRWTQEVRRLGNWIEVRVTEVTCRRDEDLNPFLRGIPAGHEDGSPTAVRRP